MTTPLEHPQGLLTIPETADLLRCTGMHVYRLIDAGELPTVDIALPSSSRTKRRVRVADLTDYLERVSVPQPETDH